jgi:NAD(P)-dependent dehydrogenase (short-subunit alcohol dehydrogenase family)
MHPSLLSQFDLSGKTALVTGASRGLGISFARGLAKANCNLVIAPRDLDRLTVVASDLEQYGGSTRPYPRVGCRMGAARAACRRPGSGILPL